MAEWVEGLHPRAPRGSPGGGQFVAKGGTGGWALDDEDRREVAKYRDVRPADLSDGASLTRAEKRSLEEYSTAIGLTYGGEPLNAYIRRGELIPKVKAEMRTLDKAVSKGVIDKDVILYRVLQSADIIADLKPGQVISDPAYTSTALSPPPARYAAASGVVTMKILAPAGTTALTVYNHLPEFSMQEEVLLPRNSKLEYVGDDPDDGSRVFKLKQDSTARVKGTYKEKPREPVSVASEGQREAALVEEPAETKMPSEAERVGAVDHREIARYRQFTKADADQLPSVELSDEVDDEDDEAVSEVDAVEGYIDIGAAALNRGLRSGKRDPEMQPIIEALDRIIARSALPEDTVLHRFYLPGSTMERLVADLKPGDAVPDKGFMSTTLLTRAELVAGGAAFWGTRGEIESSHEIKILAPKGSKAAYLGQAGHEDEREVIVARSSRLEYMGEDDDGSRVFRLIQGRERRVSTRKK